MNLISDFSRKSPDPLPRKHYTKHKESKEVEVGVISRHYILLVGVVDSIYLLIRVLFGRSRLKE
jgi:hypothetical protein